MRGRRFLFTILGLSVLASVLLVSTGGFAKQTVVYHNFYTALPEYVKGFKAVVDLFNKTHPDIEVKAEIQTTGGFAQDKLLALMAAGIPPDVAWFEQSAVIEWANEGLLTPLDDILTEEELRQRFVRGDLNEIIFEDHVWAFPWHTSVRGLVWNKDIFEETGLDSDHGPKDLKELDDMAKKLTKWDSNGLIRRWGFRPDIGNWYPPGWFWAFGGGLYDPVKKRPTLDRVENVRAFEWIQQYAKLYPYTPGITVNLETGTLAMLTTSTSDLGIFLERAPELRVWGGEVPHAPGGTNGTWIGSSCHIIPRGAKNVEAAKTFMKWLASKEAYLCFYNATRKLPAHRGAIEEVLRGLSPKDPFVPLIRQLPVAYGRPPLWYDVLMRLLAVQRDYICSLKGNPKDVLSNLQRELYPKYEKVFGKK